MSHFKKNWKMRMSSMNETNVHLNGQATTKMDISTPTKLITHQDLHQQNLQAAAAAAMALLGADQKTLFNKQELAKLNMDVKNFSLDAYAASLLERTTSRKQQHVKQSEQRMQKSPSLDDSASPSPRETSCSEETHSDSHAIKSESPSCSSSTHNDTRTARTSNGDNCSRSITPSSSRSISPSYRDENSSSASVSTTAYPSLLDPNVLAKLGSFAAAGYAAASASASTSTGMCIPSSTASNDTSSSSSSSSNSSQSLVATETLVAMTAAAAAAAASTNATANLPLTSTVATILATRKRRNDRNESERNKKIKPVPQDKKDDAYWERRRKNNEAAKRSRDLRRQKEDDIAVRAAFLEQENLKLRAQVTILKTELSKLHFMIYNR